MSFMIEKKHGIIFFIISFLLFSPLLQAQQSLKVTASIIDPISYASHISVARPLKIETIKSSPGEFVPIGLLINSQTTIQKFTVKPLSMQSKNGHNIPEHAVDIRITKKWFQASVRKVNPEKRRFLTHELLLHDNDLIQVDEQTKTNYLKTNVGGKVIYKNISNKDAKLSPSELFDDNSVLLPITLKENKDYLYWISISIPFGLPPDDYQIELGLYSDSSIIGKAKFNLEILPFTLGKSSLDYGLYYRARLSNRRMAPNSDYKTPQQYSLELINMKQHGVLYPTLYEKLSSGRVKEALKIREQGSFPKDKLFTLGLITNKLQDEKKLHSYALQVLEWKQITNEFGFKDLYIYTLDEAHNVDLPPQFASWAVSKKSGAKLFGTLRPDSFNLASELIDQPILPGRSITTAEVKKWKIRNKPAYVYSNPQVGIEDAELYRKNYGFLLWLSDYAGVMNYAYQHQANEIWNDFDHERYRDHVFAYPTTNGLIDTVQWEGFREAINDTRYIDYLAKLVGKDTAESMLITWLENSKNMHQVREKVINEIKDKI